MLLMLDTIDVRGALRTITSNIQQAIFTYNKNTNEQLRLGTL